MAFNGSSMKKKILLKGPLLTRSGYGEQARFALRSLRTRQDIFDIFIQPIQWGQTSWLNESTEERQWIDQQIERTIGYIHQGGKFDISLQVTIPNEFENLAEYNVGYTAGIETTKVAPQWIQKSNEMDKIIVVSKHSKDTFMSSTFGGVHPQTNEKLTLSLQTDIEYVNYPVKVFEKLTELPLEIPTEINFLSIAQLGPRKNLFNTIKWFLEEFSNDNIGLVVKTNKAKNCLMDREIVQHELHQLCQSVPDTKAKVYLIHGDMTDEEIHSLYQHPKVSAFLALPHGEGFGLPIFEAAYSGLPVVSVGWSGQMDFLCDEDRKENFYNVGFDIGPVQEQVIWEGVIIKESMWAYAREQSSKEKMRECYNDIINNAGYASKAIEYAENLKERFSEQNMYEKFVNNVYPMEKIEKAQKDVEDLLSDLL
tara:strand:- start:1781 stop:3052 length:1272 start_codon:yes stop_codon:yes gene_type:complete